VAQHRGRDGEWPRANLETGAGRGDPTARFQTPDGILKSDRSLAGPLRMGTSPGVGPRGSAVATGRVEGGSDFGMDRVSPRPFDPMGTPDRRAPDFPESSLVSRDIRGGNRRR
jgi:hypothetical protein